LHEEVVEEAKSEDDDTRDTLYRAGREAGATDGHICDKCIQLIPSSLNPIKECGKQDSSHVPA
jgi:hypothetical protein